VAVTRPTRAAGLLAVLVVIPGLTSAPAWAAAPVVTATTSTSTSSTTTTTLGGLTETPSSTSTTSTTIRSVQLDTVDRTYLNSVNARLRVAEGALTSAEADSQRLQTDASAKHAALANAQVALAHFDREQQLAIVAVEQAQRHLRILAVSTYLSGGPATSLNALLKSPSVDELAQRRTVLNQLAGEEIQAVHALTVARQRASQAAQRSIAVAQAAEAASQQADLQASDAAALVVQRSQTLNDMAQLFQLVTAAVTFPGTDIPRIVLDAYRHAATVVQSFNCPLTWPALAAIGKVESDHGRAHGARLAINGDLTPPIIGPALDGTNGFALVPDQDHGQWDGDTVYAHAIGPMQMIESTWLSVARDANGDGVADPNNIYDAALSAAVYLCRAVAPSALTTDAGLHDAFFSYNHSAAYADEVLALTKAYESVNLTG